MTEYVQTCPNNGEICEGRTFVNYLNDYATAMQAEASLINSQRSRLHRLVFINGADEGNVALVKLKTSIEEVMSEESLPCIGGTACGAMIALIIRQASNEGITLSFNWPPKVEGID